MKSIHLINLLRVLFFRIRKYVLMNTNFESYC